MLYSSSLSFSHIFIIYVIFFFAATHLQNCDSAESLLLQLNNCSELSNTWSFITEEFVFNGTLLEFATINPDKLNLNQEIDMITFYNSTQTSHPGYFIFMSRPIDTHRKIKCIPFKCPVMLRSLYVSCYWSNFKRSLSLGTHKKAYEPETRAEKNKFMKLFFDIVNIYISRHFFVTRYFICLVDLHFISQFWIIFFLDVSTIILLLIYRVG